MINLDILNDLILLSPFLISFLFTILLYQMFIIMLLTKQWETECLLMIPLAFDLLYFWIGAFNPPIEIARDGLRFTLGFCVCIGIIVAYSYIKHLRKKGVIDIP